MVHILQYYISFAKVKGRSRQEQRNQSFFVIYRKMCLSGQEFGSILFQGVLSYDEIPQNQLTTFCHTIISRLKSFGNVSHIQFNEMAETAQHKVSLKRAVNRMDANCDNPSTSPGGSLSLLQQIFSFTKMDGGPLIFVWV